MPSNLVPFVFFSAYGAFQFCMEEFAFDVIKRFRIQGATPPPTPGAYWTAVKVSATMPSAVWLHCFPVVSSARTEVPSHLPALVLLCVPSRWRGDRCRVLRTGGGGRCR